MDASTSGLFDLHTCADSQVLASSANLLYSYGNSHNQFELIYQLPGATRFLPAAIVRILQKRIGNKCCQYTLLPLSSGALLVIAGKRIYRIDSNSAEPVLVGQLRHYGFRVGRGILHKGLTQLPSGRIVYGEYFNNSQAGNVRIYASDDDGKTWHVLKQFEPGEVRHVHVVKTDPYTERLYVCTGDSNAASQILVSSDEGDSFQQVGGGSQLWRTCDLIFTPKHIYWGVDTTNQEESRWICRFDRAQSVLEKLCHIEAATEFGVRIEDDLFAFSTTRMGYPKEPDDWLSLWIGDGAQQWKRLRISERASKKRRANTKLASDGKSLFLAFENAKGLSGQLIRVPAASLRKFLYS